LTAQAHGMAVTVAVASNRQAAEARTPTRTAAVSSRIPATRAANVPSLVIADPHVRMLRVVGLQLVQQIRELVN
jgi:hypothetical protein